MRATVLSVALACGCSCGGAPGASTPDGGEEPPADGRACVASEVCNGLDDDCDGMVDEDVMPAGPCGSDEGECTPGELTCVGSEYVCVGDVGPTAEVCNGLDDDCDGIVDEDLCCVAGAWTQETVASLGGGPASAVWTGHSVNLDATGGIHVSYSAYFFASSSGVLSHAYRTGPGLWPSEVVVPGGDPRHPAITSNGSGDLYVAYSNNTSPGSVELASLASGGSWVLETLDANYGVSASLVADAAGALHSLYYVPTGPGGDVRYGYRSGTAAWSFETAGSSSACCAPRNAFAVDTTGGLHTVHCSTYAYRSPGGGAWSQVPFATADNDACDASLALDDSGGVHVVYIFLSMLDCCGENDGLWYAYRPPGGNFVNEPIAIDNVSAWGPAVGVSPTGSPHVAFAIAVYAPGPSTIPALRYAQRDGLGAWTTQDLDSADTIGAARVVVDTAGTVHVTHDRATASDGELRYARRCP